MQAFEKTVVDLCDFHIVLNHLGGAPKLPVESKEAYTQFCQRLLDFGPRPKPIPYENISRGGRKGVLIEDFRPGWRKETFWLHVFRDHGNRRTYGRRAWEVFAPVQGKPPRVECRAGESYGCKVSALPKIYIFPFGWSCTISLKITGPHTLATLESILADLHSKKVFEVGGEQMTVGDLFEHLAEGVRQDVFLGADATDDRGDTSLQTTVTVLARGTHEPLSADALDVPKRAMLRRIVRLGGNPPEGPVARTEIRQRGTDSGYENFLFFGPKGVFIWLAKLHLTTPGERLAEHLRCYHNNAHHSLLIARMASELIDVLLEDGGKDPVRKELLGLAISILERPPYRCVTLDRFLNEAWVKERLARAKNAA